MSEPSLLCRATCNSKAIFLFQDKFDLFQCEEACHILNAGSADAQRTRREAAATKAPDATVLRNLNDKCGAMKFRNLSDDTAKCAAAAQAVADLQNLVSLVLY